MSGEKITVGARVATYFVQSTDSQGSSAEHPDNKVTGMICPIGSGQAKNK
jgi:hypothetical protein